MIASKISAFLEFNSNNIFFFELGNQKEFLDAVNMTLKNNFVNDSSFLEEFDKKNIYKSYDLMIKDLLSLKK